LKVSGVPIEGDAENNLVVKAYRLLKKDFPDMSPINIHMFKHIPTGAGLGGGSADAAFMIKSLNEKFNLKLSIEKMEEYAAILGADCAFFIQNKPVFASGIGNIFENITLSLKGYYIVLVKPDIFVSTKDAFSHITPMHPNQSLKEIVRMPVETWRATMKNDFEESVFQKYPEIAAIKDKLYDMGAIYASMSGSGSSVFGIFREQVEHIEEVFNGCFCRQRALE
jgi:4-diphosphocytidyl-2-C-methyl-D-erythritol kinase